MSSDMERALDEILSGVNALMQQAPKPGVVTSPAVISASRGGAGVSQAAASLPSDQFISILSLLATLESSESGGPTASVASRLIGQLLVARCVRMDEISTDFGEVTVSPLIYPAFEALSAIGARWVSVDADSLAWQMDHVNIAQAQGLLRKFSSVVCPEQKDGMLLWRLPRIPERSPLNWIKSDDTGASSRLISVEQLAVIDQDRRGKKLSTILWSDQHGFVPDWWCGLAFYQGQWRPVVHWAAANVTNS